jgi:co-chaperonin GroES (HSP10)
MQVLGNAVLLLPDKQPERTPTGKIIIPETTKALQPEEGIVVQVGPACEEVRAGDHVKFPLKTASIAEIEGVVHFFVDESKIIYIYE